MRHRTPDSACLQASQAAPQQLDSPALVRTVSGARRAPPKPAAGVQGPFRGMAPGGPFNQLPEAKQDLPPGSVPLLRRESSRKSHEAQASEEAVEAFAALDFGNAAIGTDDTNEATEMVLLFPGTPTFNLFLLAKLLE